MKCCVGLCAYNSEQGLPAVLRNIDAFSRLFEASDEIQRSGY